MSNSPRTTSLAGIHAQILTNTLNTKAKLKIPPLFVNKFLAQFNYNGEALSVELLKTLNEEQCKMIWGDKYCQRVKIKFILSEYTLKEIHPFILANNSIEAAADDLGVVPLTLQRYFGKFRYQGKPLTFDLLKNHIAKIDADKWGDAYTGLLTQVSLSQLNFSEIHQCILTHRKLQKTSAALGVENLTLTRFLANTIFGDFATLLQCSDSVMIATFGAAYNQPAISHCMISTLTLAQLHAHILTHKKINNAAATLGVSVNGLKNRLARVKCEGIPLTFQFLRQLKTSDAPFILKDYNEIIKYTGKRKREDFEEADYEQQTAPACPTPVENSSMVKQATGRIGFFGETMVKKSSLISTSCAALEGRSSIFVS